MNKRTLMLGGAIALLSVTLPIAANAQVPEGYPAEYQQVIDAAKTEGSVAIYAPIDAAVMSKFTQAFNALYPEVAVEYTDLNTNVMYNRFISEVAGGAASADVMWSSALDLQGQLVADGYALPYATPEAGDLPKWAVWSEGAYGTSYEPFVFVYNKNRLKTEQLPKGHADLLATIKSNVDAYTGKTVSYNPETSGLAFYSISSDARNNPNFNEIPQALGMVKSRFSTSAGEMVEMVGSGEVAFAYNVPASYPNRALSNPDIGVIYPDDYIVVLSRIAIINAKAPHPNAAKLFLDFLLSENGQGIVAESGLYSLRSDLDSQESAGKLTETYGDRLKPPAVGPELVEYLDQSKRLAFFANWKKYLAGN